MGKAITKEIYKQVRTDIKNGNDELDIINTFNISKTTLNKIKNNSWKQYTELNAEKSAREKTRKEGRFIAKEVLEPTAKELFALALEDIREMLTHLELAVEKL